MVVLESEAKCHVNGAHLLFRVVSRAELSQIVKPTSWPRHKPASQIRSLNGVPSSCMACLPVNSCQRRMITSQYLG